MLYLVAVPLSLMVVYLAYRVSRYYALAEDWRKHADAMEGEAEAWKVAAAQWESRYWELVEDDSVDTAVE